MAFDTDHLPTILDHLWQHLGAATRSAKPPFHLPTLCSTDTEGLPRGRVVVLRRADRGSRTLICHTDRRADKVQQFRHHPHAAWLFYDPPAKVQLRVTGPVTLHTEDALADTQWAASTPSSRRCYLAPHPPGQLADEPSPNLPEAVRGRVPEPKETAAGRENFAVISCTAERFDWLYLHHTGHRRAQFEWTASDPEPAMRWLEP
ncbi:MAG: pyridoxamine 5'-phosphate oxidase family protein [Planctomycetota bacterium]